MIKKLMFGLVVVFISFYTVEFILIMTSPRPITFQFYSKKKVDDSSLGLVIDDDGIYSHPPDFLDKIESLKNSISHENNLIVNDPTTLYFLLSCLAESIDTNTITSILPGYLSNIGKEINDDIRKDGYNVFREELFGKYDSIQDQGLYRDLKLYTENWINTKGFRSINFKNYNNKGKKIMLLGDSFTYGQSAMPLYYSFSDLLLKEGYVTYNLGIPGTNVINYYANAKKFVPVLKPDYVFTFYYPVNDHVYFPWDSTNYVYLPGHIINQSWLPTYVNSNYYPDFEEWKAALKNCLNNQLPLSFLNSFLSYNIVMNRLYGNSINECFSDNTNIDVKNTHFYLNEINELCMQHGSKHIIIVIPPYNMSMVNYEIENQNGIFNGLDVKYPIQFIESDYKASMKDPHFNNTGHEKMKDYVIEIIENGK